MHCGEYSAKCIRHLLERDGEPAMRRNQMLSLLSSCLMILAVGIHFSAQDVSQQFRSPSKTYRPMVRWWWPSGGFNHHGPLPSAMMQQFERREKLVAVIAVRGGQCPAISQPNCEPTTAYEKLRSTATRNIGDIDAAHATGWNVGLGCTAGYVAGVHL